MTLFAALAAAGTAWLTIPPEAAGTLRHRLCSSTSPASAVPAWALRWLPLGGVAAGLLMLPGLVHGRTHLLIIGATALLSAWGVGVLVRRGRARARRLARRSQVVGLCDALVAELQSGQLPASALAAVVDDWPELRTAGDCARLGGDVPAALRALAVRPGGEPLTAVAAGWQVAHSSGAGLAELLERLSGALRDDDEVRREVAATLGPPRATARMLAGLPLAGIGLGVAIGADPVAVLTGSLFGSICLAVGAALALAGLFWVEHIVDGAEV